MTAPTKLQEWALEADSQARIDKIKTKEQLRTQAYLPEGESVLALIFLMLGFFEMHWCKAYNEHCCNCNHSQCQKG